MGDLEELMLKRNVPGRYSSWDRDENDDLPSDEEENITKEQGNNQQEEGQGSNDVIDKVLTSKIPEQLKFNLLEERDGKHQTGVKGTLADYKMNKKLEQAERVYREQERKNILTRIAEGHKVSNINEIENPHGSDFVKNKQEDDEEDDDEDDEFMAEYREKRLQELKNSYAKPTFSRLKEVTTHDDFLQEIEGEDKRVYVIVHLYASNCTGSIRMTNILENIARKLIHVKFLNMNLQLSGMNGIDKVALPILSIYKGGETVEVLAGLMEEFGSSFLEEDIQWLLESKTQL